MKSGLQTSISENAPIDKEAIRKKKDEEEKKLLEEKAKFANLSESEAGKTLLDIIAGRMIVRIDKFILTDPECKALNEVLVSMGGKEITGKAAVNNIVKKYFPNAKISDKTPVV